MRAVLLDAAGEPVLRDVPEPSGPGELVRVRVCGLCGSDVEKLGSAAPGTVLGHEVVAETEDGRRVVLVHHLPCGECDRCRAGHESTCERFRAATIVPGGFAERARAAQAIEVPDGVDDVTATFAEPLACVLRGIERVPRGRVLVVGHGFVGRLFTFALRRRGDSAFVHDIDPTRATGREADGPVDAVVLCAPGGAAEALAALEPGGTLLVFASGGTIDLDAVYRRELHVLGCRSATPRHLYEAVELLPALDPIPADVLPLERFAEGLDRYRSGQALKVVFTPTSAEDEPLPAEASRDDFGAKSRRSRAPDSATVHTGVPGDPLGHVKDTAGRRPRRRAMRALVFHGPGDVRLEEVPDPEPGPGDVLVEVEVALTDGTDAKAFRRGHPVLLGPPPSPFGHEFCGIDTATGRRVVAANSAPCGACAACRRGQETLCDSLLPLLNGAYAELLLVPERIATTNLLRVPDRLAPEVAALVEPLACCLHGVAAAEVREGDRVAVLGPGPIGLMLCACVRDAGGTPIAVGGRRERRELAQHFGATPGDGDAADVVIEAAGTPAAWQEAVELVRPGGTVLLFGGLPSGTAVPVDAHRLHYDQLTLRGAFHHTPQTVRAALAFLASGAFPWHRLVTHEIGLEGVAGLLADPPRDLLKAAVRP